MKHFPAFVDMTKYSVTIIGGGSVAQRKLEVLVKFTNDIELISKEFCSGIKLLAQQHGLSLIYASYNKAHIRDSSLVIAATDNEAINQAVSIDAKNKKCLVNVVDQPDLCDYITPAIIDRSPVCIALSSGGNSPVMLRMLRSRIESQLPFNLGEIALFCDSKRDQVKTQFASVDQRRHFWESFFQQLSIQSNDSPTDWQLIFDQLLDKTHQVSPVCFTLDCNMDIDDINLRAIKRMQSADLLIAGNNVPQSFIELVRRDAEKSPEKLLEQNLLMLQQATVSIGFNLSYTTEQVLTQHGVTLKPLLQK